MHKIQGWVRPTVVIATVLSLSACSTDSPATKPTQLEVPTPTVHAVRALQQKEIQLGLAPRLTLLRRIINETATDAMKNQDQWFGKSGHRTKASFCTGLVAVFSKHVVDLDRGLGASPTPTERQLRLKAFLSGTQCAEPRQLNIYAAMPSVLATAGAAATLDSASDFMTDNYHQDAVTTALDSYSEDLSEMTPGNYGGYESGLSSFDISVFEATADQQNSNLVTFNDEEQEGYGDGLPELPFPTSVFLWPAWAHAMLHGCVIGTIGAGDGIVTAGVEGFGAGGPVGAAAGAIGAAMTACGYGALGAWTEFHAF